MIRLNPTYLLWSKCVDSWVRAIRSTLSTLKALSPSGLCHLICLVSYPLPWAISSASCRVNYFMSYYRPRVLSSNLGHFMSSDSCHMIWLLSCHRSPDMSSSSCPINGSVSQSAWLLACLPACLPAYLPTCLPAYQPTCLHAYLPNKDQNLFIKGINSKETIQNILKVTTLIAIVSKPIKIVRGYVRIK